MKILVTGGAGYIGSHTAVELLKAGYDITIVDNLSNSSIDVIDAIKEITGKDFNFYKLDVKNERTLNKVFKEVDGNITNKYIFIFVKYICLLLFEWQLFNSEYILFNYLLKI